MSDYCRLVAPLAVAQSIRAVCSVKLHRAQPSDAAEVAGRVGLNRGNAVKGPAFEGRFSVTEISLLLNGARVADRVIPSLRQI
jgi:hypothetical protein